MAKLEAEIEALRARASVLESRAQDAQLSLDRALVARQTHLLSGDLDDNGHGDRLQKAVDTASSKLAGLNDALGVLRGQIADVESKLAAEREVIERAASSERLTKQLAAVESAFRRWQDATRELGDALKAIELRSFELDQVGTYLSVTTAPQIEIAIGFTLDELKRTVIAIKKGHAAPSKPPVEAEVIPLRQDEPSATSPGEETQTVFVVRPMKWKSKDGRQQYAPRWSDAELCR